MARGGGANPQKKMTIMGHIRELQARLTLSAIVVVVASSLAYVFRDPILDLLLSPLDGQPLIYLNPAGGFSFIFMVSIYVGLAVAAPVIIHQLYSFLRPTLPEKVRRYSVAVFLCSLILLAAGVTFGQLFAIPGALDFLNTFASEYIDPSLTADSYMNFIIAYSLGLGLVFQVPLLLMLLHWIKPQTPKGLLKSERWVIVLAFIAAAIITPTPDPLNQTLIALPVIIVYQLGVIAVLISIYRERRRAKRIKITKPASTGTLYEPPEDPTPPKPSQPAAKPYTAPMPVAPRPRPAVASVTPAPRFVNNLATDRPQRTRPTMSDINRRPGFGQATERRLSDYHPSLTLDGISKL